MTGTFSKTFFEGTVLINGANTTTGYNAARSLRGYGFKIYGQSNEDGRHSIYVKSRLWEKVFFSDISEANLIGISEELMHGTSIKSHKPVLILSQDQAVDIVSRISKNIAPHFSFQLPSREITNVLLDKAMYSQWASENGVLIPRTVHTKTKKEVGHALDSLTYPLVIKPLYRADSWDKKFPNDKLLKMECQPKSIEALSSTLDLNTELVIQEWIPGEDSDVYFLLAHFGNEKTTSIGGRKIFQWPIKSGSTSMCRTFNDGKMEELGLEALKLANPKGLCSIEFKRNRENGMYYVTEPTVGRNDYQSFLGTAAGCNLTLFYTLDCLGYNYLAPDTTNNAIWIDEINCIRSIRASIPLSSFTSTISGLKNVTLSFANFSLFEPKIIFRLCLNILYGKFRRLITLANN